MLPIVKTTYTLKLKEAIHIQNRKPELNTSTPSSVHNYPLIPPLLVFTQHISSFIHNVIPV